MTQPAESTAADPSAGGGAAAAVGHRTKTPLYWRLLRLRNIRPNGWQRAVLVEGVLAVSVTLVLADVASAWTLLALPLASLVVVKAHDVLVGMLRPDAGSSHTRTAPPPPG